MARPFGLAVPILVAAGVILVLAGVAAAGVGWLDPQLISDRLPRDAQIDAPAVGGAAVALGVAIAILGLVHLVITVALRRGSRVASTAAVVVAATMAVLSFGFGVAALVSLASGAAPALLMVPAAIGLAGALIAYGAATAMILHSHGARI